MEFCCEFYIFTYCINFRFGGIIPPVAQDLHRQHIENVVKQTFNLAKVKPEDIDAIAVTTRPGIMFGLIFDNMLLMITF